MVLFKKIAAKMHKKRKKSRTLGFLRASRGPRMHLAWVPLSGRIKRSDAGPKQIDLFAPVHFWNSLSDQFPDRFSHLIGIVINQNICQALVVTLLTTEDGPDE